MKLKLSLISIFSLVVLICCGQTSQLSPNGIFETVYDRFGNGFSLEQIVINNNNTQSRFIDPVCESGIFRLHFDNGSGFENPNDPEHIARRLVACQVFNDLSNFIITPLHDNGNTQKVEIWVRPFSSISTASGVIGVASGFNIIPLASTNIGGGILDNEVWKTIHLGTNSYNNIISPSLVNNGGSNFYHGYFAMNFDVNWNLDLNQMNPTNFDLYSVILHEATHALGISSLINSNGISKINIGGNQYYNRYDTFLFSSNGTTPLLTAINPLSQLYENNFTAQLNDIHPDNPISPCDPEITVCSSVVNFSGVNISNLPIHTPECFSGSSLSHFEDSCISGQYNDQYFVMSNATFLGTIKRFFKEEERKALCEIGYSLQSTFGSTTANNEYNYLSSGCDGIQVAGLNDGFNFVNNFYSFVGSINSSININDILDNDINATHFEGLEDVYDSTSNLSTTSGDASTNVIFETSTLGIHLLRYVPYNDITNERGNITYIYVYVLPQEESEFCGIPNVCDLVINGDFEQNSEVPFIMGQITNACNWNRVALGSSPDYYYRNSNPSNVSIPNNWIGYENDINGDGYAGIYVSSSTYSNAANGSREILKTKLKSPLQPNTTYQLSFDVSIADNHSYLNNAYFFQAYLSTDNYSYPYLSGGIPISINPGDINGIHLQNLTPSTTSNGWDRVILTFTTDSTASQEYLYLGRYLAENNSLVDFPPLNDGPGFNLFTLYYYIDNVSLIQVEYFDMPNEVCLDSNTSTLTLNLEDYLNPSPSQIGVFSGQGVTGSIFTTSNTGVYTIDYTYVNNNNCQVTISQIFSVLDCETATTPIIQDFDSLCINEIVDSNILSTFYYDENGMLLSGIWNPSTISTSTSGNFEYTFVPTPGQNAYSVIKTITVVEPITPIFDVIQPICVNHSAPELETISNNGISGVWLPNQIDTSTEGLFTYTFIPNNGECAVETILQVEIIYCNPQLSWETDVSCEITEGVKDPKLPGDSNINDGTCIKVCENSTINYSLTGDLSIISDTQWNITGGTISYEDNANCEILWNGNIFSYIEAVVTFINGEQVIIHRCVEKVENPNALFEVVPAAIEYCSNTPISFINLSSTPSGNGTLYFNWNFGDGTSSTEFEPTHIYLIPDEYTVTLQVFNGCSCTDVYELVINIEEGIRPIECVGVVCENDISTYDINSQCSVSFDAIGGTIIEDFNNQVTIIWDHVDPSGFGTVITNCDTGCTSSIQVPVILNEGKILGDQIICENQQQIFRLPQWPTTDFTWSLDDGGTGAYLILNEQRNEIIVQTVNPGTLVLYCNYKNTLLGCGGNAELAINVIPNLTISPSLPICVDSTQNYQFIAEGNPISQSISYIIEGPNNYYNTGSGVGFTFNPSLAGIYNIISLSSDYCVTSPLIINVLNEPQAPTVIIGEDIVCPETPYIYSVPSLSGGIANWTVNGGTILGSNSGNSVMVKFDSNATPPYQLSVYYERLGCIGASTTIEINPDIPIVNFVQAPTPVCSSSVANYMIESDNQLDFINWSVSPSNVGSIISGQNTPEIQINWNNITAQAIVKATVRKCGIEYEFETIVDVNLAPLIQIVADDETCAGLGFPVSFSVQGITSGTVNWDFGDGTTGTGQNVIHPFTEPLTSNTQYNVTVEVSNPNGCLNSSSANHLITVSPSPVISLDSTPYLNLCDGSNVNSDYNFTIILQGGWAQSVVPSISWYHNGNLIANNTPTLTIDNNSVDPLSLVGYYYAVVSNSFGCSATTSIIRVVNDCPTTGNGNCLVTDSIDSNLNINCDSIVLEAIPNGTPSYVVFRLSNGQTITDTSSPFSATFSNLQPGLYSYEIRASESPFISYCWTPIRDTLIIPYEADLKYDVSCNNGVYNLVLKDYSRFYDPLGNNPINNYEFTINGVDWIPGILNNVTNIQEAIFSNLSPDTYQVGIRIQGGSFDSCTRIYSLELDDFPIASFTQSHTFICEGEAVTFTPDILNPEWTYEWTFSDLSENSSPVTKKSFDFTNGNNQFIVLTVTNKYGCSISALSSIEILDERINGILVANQDFVCMGTPVTLSYTSIPTTEITNPELPNIIEWYGGNQSNLLYTSSSIQTFTITEPGYYFAYGYNINGCKTTTNIAAINVTMIPIPMAEINGPDVICNGSLITLNTPANAGTNYYWSVNGSALPSFNGLSTINYTPTGIGNYSFELITETSDGQGNTCLSLPSIHNVTVLASPQVPEIKIIGVQCEPYLVTAIVSSPEPGVVYYWSNGTIGTTTTITHDGPLQVRAEAFGCYTTSQIDLPLDLKQHEWLFPKGCYDYCKIGEFNGYIIGPLGEIKWTWLHDSNVESSGNETVDSVQVSEGSYNLTLMNDWCQLTFGTTAVQANECDTCDISIEPLDIHCDSIYGTDVYVVSLHIYNNMNGVSLVLTSPNGEGYFSPSTFQAAGLSTTIYNGYFIPDVSFMGGTVLISIEGTDGVEVICRNVYELNLSCEENPRMAEPKDKIILSPNPTVDKAQLLYELIDLGNVQLLVTDISGRELYRLESKNNFGKFDIDLSLFPEGYYPITVIQNGNVIYNSKLLKN